DQLLKDFDNLRLEVIVPPIQTSARIAALTIRPTLRDRIRAAQDGDPFLQKIKSEDRQKSYADRRRKDLSFNVGDKVFLKVAPMKGVLRFGKKGKLQPRFIGPFEILQKVGNAAYRIALPPDLSAIHNVFHVSMLRQYVSDPSHVVNYQPLDIKSNMTYEEKPVSILDRRIQRLRTKEIPLVRVQWRNHNVEESTWEREDEIKIKYPELFN
ncbi:uncharacterized protein LOC111373722, partial [Olea europaea var. sylvestris]|uniref:uncharacterized protein LOC111373722 n=1 Tax=Olea europaea var. sylvestris TaxID=158386 RepID=UPI000C1D78EE